MGTKLFCRLEKAVTEGIIEPLDLEFAKFLSRLDPEAPDQVILAGCLASHAVTRSNTCIDLDSLPETDNTGLGLAVGIMDGISLDEVKRLLNSSPLIARPGEDRPAPLIFEDGRRLYLQRYYKYEVSLSASLSRLASRDHVLRPEQIDKVQGVFSRFFKGQDRCDWQRVAVATALLKGLCIVSGGPGTGKTRTVAAIIAAIKAAWDQNSIAVAAPTGKAATRLKHSIDSVFRAKGLFKTDQADQEAFTLHRLLGADSRGWFRFGPEYRLPYDTVIVDEASMVDLPLMSRLVEALPPDARLILLGDKDQLASVEAGNVLSDICYFSQLFNYSSLHAEAVLKLSGDSLPFSRGKFLALRDCIVELKKNFRFEANSPIADMASAICRGDEEQLFGILTKDNARGARLFDPRDVPISTLLAKRSRQHFLPCLNAKSPSSGLSRLQGFRILCAHRSGPHGTEMVNKTISTTLLGQETILKDNRFFQGQPLIILKNSYRYSIFNGDICIVWPDTTGRLRAWFEQVEGTCRHLPITSLPENETAFAITVHKSQGSEFDRVLLVLPDGDSPLLTRELLYTAVTRARKAVEIWGTRSSLKRAVHQRLKRFTGLRDKLLQSTQ